mmetsp:Transcript_17531/g.26620  ORF Transcript_17531/g.26620 Transcript_17531/m.26620 type:complete len:110 (-) Transcript_17531:68-397(-)
MSQLHMSIITKAQLRLGWSPKVPIEEGMELFLEWYQAKDASKYMISSSTQTQLILIVFLLSFGISVSFIVWIGTYACVLSFGTESILCLLFQSYFFITFQVEPKISDKA